MDEIPMHRFLAPLLVASALSVSGVVLANDGPKPIGTKSALKPADHADELFDQGAVAFDAGRFAEAEAKLSAAWALKQTYDIAGNLGVVEARLGKYPQASEHLTWALQHFPPTETSKARRGYEEELAKARAQSAALRIRVSEDDAEVSVNGRVLGVSPMPEVVFMEPGEMRVEVKLKGYADARQVIRVGAGREEYIGLTLIAQGPGPTPIAAQKPGPNKGILIAGGATAGVALVAGVVLAVASTSKGSAADHLLDNLKQTGGANPCQSHAADCATINSDRTARDKLADGALVSFIGAGALAAATITYAVVARTSGTTKSATRVHLMPVVGTGQGGFVVSGTW